MSTPATYYLRFVACLSAFRVCVYILNLEMVTKVKIAKKDWEDPRVRDIAFMWTKQIRTFMTMRTLIFGAGSYLRNREERNILAAVSFSFDVYMMFVIYSLYWAKPVTRPHSVLVHENPLIPSFIQSLHILAFLVAFYSEHKN